MLKQFGRENSGYAVSSQRNIKRQAGAAAASASGSELLDVKTKKKKDVFGKPKTTSTLKTKVLQKLAQDATSAHTASISNNGKYISFRHAGGNYLADYTSIVNVVGRFIRAMIIAADPAAYAQEYQTKLAKLAHVGEAPVTTRKQALLRAYKQVREHGLPVFEILAVNLQQTTAKDVAKNTNPLDRFTIDSSQVSSRIGGEAVRQQLINDLQSDYLKQSLAGMSETDFYVITVVVKNANQIEWFQKVQVPAGVNYVRKGGRKIALVKIVKSQIPASDSRAKSLLKGLVTNLIKEK